ncbi:MAG: hypothetical protein ACK5LX_15095 [Oscillospiraceae bacterium]
MRRHSRSGLFLLELIFATGLFAICAAVCVQMFVKAAVVGRESHDLSVAAGMVQSGAEAIRSTGGDAAEAAKLFRGGTSEGNLTFYVPYDAEGFPIYHTGVADYLMRVDVEPGTVSDVEISVYRIGEDEAFYTLPIQIYTPNGESLAEGGSQE